MADFTPGPWEVIAEKGNENFAHSIYSEGYKGLLIARCDQNGAYAADARLIAAAPDMYEALQNALASGLPDVVAQAARAAIAKAQEKQT